MICLKNLKEKNSSWTLQNPQIYTFEPGERQFRAAEMLSIYVNAAIIASIYLSDFR